jgi:hypothetical protein
LNQYLWSTQTCICTLHKAMCLAGCSRRGQLLSLCRPGYGLHGRDSIPFSCASPPDWLWGPSNVSGCYRGLITRGKTAGALIWQHTFK